MKEIRTSCTSSLVWYLMGLLLFIPNEVTASLLFSVSVDGSAVVSIPDPSAPFGFRSDNVRVQTGELEQDQVGLDIERSVSGTLGFSDARMLGDARLGHLTGRVFAQSDLLLRIPPGGGTGVASSGATMTWSDTITPESSTLPAGTFVEFMARLDLESRVYTTGGVPAFPGFEPGSDASARIFVNGLAGPFLQNKIVDSGVFQDQIRSQTASTTFFPRIGVPFGIGGVLHLGALEDSNNSFRSVTTEAIALNSALFHLDAGTPGVTYSTASGHTYSSSASVPEPSVIMLFITGLAVWMCSYHRRRTSAHGRCDSLCSTAQAVPSK